MSLEILEQPIDYPRTTAKELVAQEATKQVKSDAVNSYIRTSEENIAALKQQLVNYKVWTVGLAITVLVLSYALCKPFLV
jgi:hypothetical protein